MSKSRYGHDRLVYDDALGWIEPAVDAVRRLGAAITPVAIPGTDATGGTVDSLTEAVMGVTAGLVRIASAIESLADAVRDKGDDDDDR